jgi:hypothetical protein
MKYLVVMVPTMCVAIVVGLGLGLVMFAVTFQGTLNAFILEAHRRFRY